MPFDLTVRDQSGDMQTDASEAVVGDQVHVLIPTGQALSADEHIMMNLMGAIYWT